MAPSEAFEASGELVPPDSPLAHKLAHLPSRPGCYLFKDAAGKVIYVGKAVSLRNRVRSYFHQSRRHPARTAALVQNIADLDYIVTASEVEALILECNLIKEQSPRYNVRLKDDKAYPYIKVTDEAFPRVMVARRRGPDGRYFGPFTDAGAVRTTLAFLRKLFPIRTCSLDLSGELDYRPCLLYHIGRCGAPCAGLQSAAEYGAMIDEVCLFLEGRHDKLIPGLKRQMEAAAEALEFEKAARLRDQLGALQKLSERQEIVSKGREDQDVLGVALQDGLACVQIFFVRDGKLIGRDHFFLDAPGAGGGGADGADGANDEGEATPEAEILSAFAAQYYADAGFVPKEVLVPAALDDAPVLETWLEARRGAKVHLHVPQRGHKRRLVEMVQENARLVLAERCAQIQQSAGRIQTGLAELAALLELPGPPGRIEAYDISNTQGAQSVASMVVLTDGRPDNRAYRRFRIKSVEGPNDFASMQEVIHRRFVRGLRARGEWTGEVDDVREQRVDARFADFPDLVLIDGGKGQLHAARDVMRELGVADIPTIGLAKQLELIIVEDQDEPLQLPHDHPALHILQTIRDEAHRFALTYHRKLRSNHQSKAALDGIEGVGPKRKRQLIKHFGSLSAVYAATLDQLLAVPGLPETVAQRIFEQTARN